MVSGRVEKWHKRGRKKKLCMTQSDSEATIVSIDMTALYCAKDSLCLRKFELANDTYAFSASSVRNRRPTAMLQRFALLTL